MIELDPGALTGAVTIVASIGAGLLGRRAIAALDAKRERRLARQARAYRSQQLPAAIRR